MIESFRHKGLSLLYHKGDRRRLDASMADRVDVMLADLDAALEVSDLDLPAYRLHPLKGRMAGRWAMTVRTNWRITFRFERGNARDVDLEDYH